MSLQNQLIQSLDTMNSTTTTEAIDHFSNSADLALFNQELLAIPNALASENLTRGQKKCPFIRGLKDNSATQISSMHAFARRFATHDQALLAVECHSSPRDMRIALSPKTCVASSLIHLLSADFNKLRALYPLHEFSPVFEAFATVARRFRLDWRSIITTTFTVGDAQYMKRAFESAARCLQRRLRAKRAQKGLAKFRKSALRNYNSVIQYLDHCLQRRSNLTVIRLDLHYNTKLDDLPTHWTDAVKIGTPAQDSRSFTNIHRDRNKFFAWMKNRYRKGLVGHLWKIEYGPERKFHVHCLILLDAAMHQRDISICEVMGEHWALTITKGTGSYFNCNKDKWIYQYCALGKVDVTDENVLIGLRYLASYFTLAELFVRQVFTRKCRSLGKGEIKPIPTKKRGRPTRYVAGALKIKPSVAIKGIFFI